MRRAKGWSSAVERIPRATHYVSGDPTRALCNAPIRYSAEALTLLPTPIAKALRALEICDHCQTAARRRA